MHFDLNLYFDRRREQLTNRARFPVEKLAAYAGQWIAWSPDGSRIVAHTADPEGLDDCIRAVGEDPQLCLVEGIPAEDSVLGAVQPGVKGR